MELANKVSQYLLIPASEITYENTSDIYFEIFGVRIKKGCGICVDDARYKLMKWYKQKKVMANCKYRFKKEFTNKTVVLSFEGAKVAINQDNLTDDLADMLINNGRGKVIELNPDFVEKKKVEVTKVKEEISQHTLSTSNEVVIDGRESNQNATENESDTSELTQLMEVKKKRGRPSKVKG